MVVSGKGLTGVVAEVKSLIRQALTWEGDFFTTQQLIENPAVFSKQVVDVAHVVVAVAVGFVVEGVTAKVAAELFVDPPPDKFTALGA